MIIDSLKKSLANHIEASLIVNGYHWNVEGINYTEYHSFFGEIYTDYYKQVDTIAEYIRIISDSTDYVNSSVDIVRLNKSVKADIIVGEKYREMCQAIIVINDELIKDIDDIDNMAKKQNLIGLSNYCADRNDILTKLNWKLLAITK